MRPAFGRWSLPTQHLPMKASLNSWSLSITSGELFRTTDEDGNYSFDSLSPATTSFARNHSQVGCRFRRQRRVFRPQWTGIRWDVTVVGIDDFNVPDGPDSHRNVKNVDFGNLRARRDRSRVTSTETWTRMRRRPRPNLACPVGRSSSIPTKRNSGYRHGRRYRIVGHGPVDQQLLSLCRRRCGLAR